MLTRGSTRVDEADALAVADSRFAARTTTGAGGCRIWTGYRDRQGYGLVMRVAISKSPLLAHRYAWSLINGPIPDRQVVRHSCDNPPCVNPGHLQLGTQADNIDDRQRRGRHRPGRLYGEAHPAHKLTAENVAEIRRLYPVTSTGALALRFGVSRRTVYMAAKGLTWKAAA